MALGAGAAWGGRTRRSEPAAGERERGWEREKGEGAVAARVVGGLVGVVLQKSPRIS